MDLLRWCLFFACSLVLAAADEQPGAHRQARQGTITLARTMTVAVTEVAFETVPSVCVSLVGASAPCVGRRAVRNVDFQVEPTSVRRCVFVAVRVASKQLTVATFLLKNFKKREIIKSAEPSFNPEARSLDDSDLIQSSMVTVGEGRQSNQTTGGVAGFFQSLSQNFSAAFGIVSCNTSHLKRTQVISIDANRPALLSPR